MRKSELRIMIREALDSFAEERFTGLGRAKPGDTIEIGVQGRNWKKRVKVDKIITKNGQKQIIDTEGNIFMPNGQLVKAKSHDLITFKLPNSTKPRQKFKKVQMDKVSARQVTKKEVYIKIKEFVVKQLREYDWMKLTPTEMIEVGKIIHRGFPQLEDIKDLNYEKK